MTKLFARDGGPAVDVDPHGYQYGYDEFMAEFGKERADAILEAIVEERSTRTLHLRNLLVAAILARSARGHPSTLTTSRTSIAPFAMNQPE